MGRGPGHWAFLTGHADLRQLAWVVDAENHRPARRSDGWVIRARCVPDL